MTRHDDALMSPDHEWLDLSDGELVARLLQHGLDESDAGYLVHHREELHAIQAIAKVLSGDA